MTLYFWPYSHNITTHQDPVLYRQRDLMNLYHNLFKEASQVFNSGNDGRAGRVARARGKAAKRLVPRWLAYALDLVTVLERRDNGPVLIRWATSEHMDDEKARLLDALEGYPRRDRQAEGELIETEHVKGALGLRKSLGVVRNNWLADRYQDDYWFKPFWEDAAMDLISFERAVELATEDKVCPQEDPKKRAPSTRTKAKQKNYPNRQKALSGAQLAVVNSKYHTYNNYRGSLVQDAQQGNEESKGQGRAQANEGDVNMADESLPQKITSSVPSPSQVINPPGSQSEENKKADFMFKYQQKSRAKKSILKSTPVGQKRIVD